MRTSNWGRTIQPQTQTWLGISRCNHSMDAVVLGSVVPATGPKLNALQHPGASARQRLDRRGQLDAGKLAPVPTRERRRRSLAALDRINRGFQSDFDGVVEHPTRRRCDHAQALARRLLPTQVVISTGSGGSFLRHVPTKGGTIKFPAVVTDSLRIHITGVALRYTLSPAAGVQLTLPVGLSNIGIPGLLPADYAALDPRYRGAPRLRPGPDPADRRQVDPDLGERNARGCRRSPTHAARWVRAVRGNHTPGGGQRVPNGRFFVGLRRVVTVLAELRREGHERETPDCPRGAVGQ